MISIYGISIMHLAERPYVDQAHVCSEIGKCFDNEKSALAFARITGVSTFHPPKIHISNLF